MKIIFAKKKFIFYFIWIPLLFVFLPSYIESGAICLSLFQTKGEIRGSTIDEDGNPLPGVSVTLISDVAFGQTRLTNMNGQFRFINLNPGIYSIRAELPGFNAAIRSNISVTFGGSISMNITMAIGDIDETGGIPNLIELPGQISKPGNAVIRPSTSVPNIPHMTMPNNFGINPFTQEKIPMEYAQCYYSDRKIYAKHGIAKVGQLEERLNNITEFPYGDERYALKNLNVENGCVYAIRVGPKNKLKTLLIRVIEIFEDGIMIEYWIQNER